MEESTLDSSENWIQAFRVKIYAEARACFSGSAIR